MKKHNPGNPTNLVGIAGVIVPVAVDLVKFAIKRKQQIEALNRHKKTKDKPLVSSEKVEKKD